MKQVYSSVIMLIFVDYLFSQAAPTLLISSWHLSSVYVRRSANFH